MKNLVEALLMAILTAAGIAARVGKFFLILFVIAIATRQSGRFTFKGVKQ